MKSIFKVVLKGASTLLVIYPAAGHAYLEPSETKNIRDALRSDVQRIGGDFERATKKHEQKTQLQQSA